VVAALLDEAGRLAIRRNAMEAAAQFAEHAARLTAPGDVPSRARRLADVAWYYSDWDEARSEAAADRVLELDVHGPDRGRALLIRADGAPTWEEYVRQFRLVREEPGLDPALAASLRAEAAWDSAGYLDGDLEEAWREARAALEDVADEAPNVRVGIMVAGCRIASIKGDPQATELFEECVKLVEPGVRSANNVSARINFAFHLLSHGWWDRAVEQLDTEEREALEVGNDRTLGLSHAVRGWVEMTRGDWDELDRRLAALEVLSRDSPPLRDRWAAPAAMLAARRGDAGALEAATLLHSEGLMAHPRGPDGLIRGTSALLHVARGEPALGADVFSSWIDIVPRAGAIRHQMLAALPEAVTSLVAADRFAEAEALVRTIDVPARHEPLASVLEHLGTGMVALGRGVPAAGDLLSRARQGARSIDAGWLVAQASYAEGLALRRAGQRTAAAAAFQSAADRFTAMHATPWAERASTAAQGAVPRPRHDETLTPREVTVAELAATGMRNTEIAAHLYVTVATVEAHLTRIYRKLGVRSRAGLAKALASAPKPHDGTVGPRR
jgi:ATP/maltotriose-dependent transcriptional regulator MalT